MRWRISAAIIDNMLVYATYLLICGVLGWRVYNVGHLLVLLVTGVAYHFLMESRDGQTVGKRQYGLRVVAVDGSPAGLKAIAMRSVLRIIDALPFMYLSGLVNMVRTGPARRQRIGDVAGDTKVVAVAGRSLERGTPGWLLPAATSLALLFSVGSIYEVAQASGRPLSASQQAQFVEGCQRSSGGLIVDCECLLSHLEANGYVTLGDLQNLMSKARNEAAVGHARSARRELVSDVLACRR